MPDFMDLIVLRRKIKQLFVINGRKKDINGTEMFLTEDLIGRI